MSFTLPMTLASQGIKSSHEIASFRIEITGHRRLFSLHTPRVQRIDLQV